MEVLEEILPNILGGTAIALITWLGTKVANNGKRIMDEKHDIQHVLDRFDDLMKDHAVLMKSQRDQIKNSIVRICDECLRRGAISISELECLEKLYESYVALGGNSYIATLIAHVKELPIDNNHMSIDTIAAIQEYMSTKEES